MKKVMIVLILLLSGCQIANNNTTSNDLEYVITELPLRAMLEDETKGKLEFRQMYNNKLNLSYLKDNGSFYSTNSIYTFDIDTHEITEFTDHDAFADNERIWSFVIFDEEEWLYCAVYFDEDEGENGLLSYDVIHEKSGIKEVLLTGITNNYYTLPDFLCDENDVYFLASTLIYGEQRDQGNYQIGMFKFHDYNLEQLLLETGPYSDFYLADDTKYCGDEIFFNENNVSFISQDLNNKYLHTYNDGIMITEEFDDLYSIVPLKDYLIVTKEKDNTGKYDSYSTYILTKSDQSIYDVENALIYNMIIPLSDNMYIGINRLNNNVTINKVIDGKTIISKTLDEVSYIIAYRRINSNTVLLLSINDTEMSYLIQITD